MESQHPCSFEYLSRYCCLDHDPVSFLCTRGARNRPERTSTGTRAAVQFLGKLQYTEIRNRRGQAKAERTNGPRGASIGTFALKRVELFLLLNFGRGSLSQSRHINIHIGSRNVDITCIAIHFLAFQPCKTRGSHLSTTAKPSLTEIPTRGCTPPDALCTNYVIRCASPSRPSPS
jgi:hypothetical protein